MLSDVIMSQTPDWGGSKSGQNDLPSRPTVPTIFPAKSFANFDAPLMSSEQKQNTICDSVFLK